MNVMLGRRPADSERMHLGLLLGHLIRTALVWCLDWDVVCDECLSADQGDSAASLLADHRLALYLLRLKNGSAADRTAFETIQGGFRALTGAALNVRLHVVPGKPSPTFEKSVRPLTNLRRQSLPAQPQNVPAQYAAQVITDHELPLTDGGSGRSQVALLAALAHYHASKVVLLDEPELHLNPAMAAELASQLMGRREQTIVVTQSPYMIPPSALAKVRRIAALPAAPSRVSPRVGRRDISELSLRKRPAYPEDAMFLFSWCTVFVEGPNEAAALRVWFDKWCARRRAGRHAGERLGVRFHFVSGANGIMPWLRIATLFAVPCLGLYDADVLSRQPSKRKDSKSVPDQWREAGLVRPDEVVPWGDGAWLHLLHERDKRIFFCGATAEDDFESLPVCVRLKQRAEAAVRGGPLMYRWIAEETPPPPEFSPLFTAAWTLAEETRRGARGADAYRSP